MKLKTFKFIRSGLSLQGLYNLKSGLKSIVLWLMLGLWASVNLTAYAMTPADTVINNQATATYTDSGDVARSITSNTVQTVIQQVASVSLTASQTKPTNAGNTILFPHIVTNTGNGADRFSLTATDLFGSGSDFAFSSITIFPDVDANGEPDSTIAITETPDLAQNASFPFVIEVTIPASGLGLNDQAQLELSAVSQADNAQLATNTDTAIISDRAIIEITKALSQNLGEAGSGPYRVELFYNNPSDDVATDLTILDILPSGMLYAGNATWSIGSIALTDIDEDVQGSNPSIAYCAYDTTCINGAFDSNQVTFIINEVGAGQSGTVSFDVTIDAGAMPGTIFNTANYQYFDTVAQTALADSNTAPFTILPTAAVTFTGETIADIQPGQTGFFNNVLTNNSNASDVFNVDLDAASSTFPSGTFLTLLRDDGFTPLTDSNGDGIPDTGPVESGDSFTVILQAVVPSDTAAGTYSIDKTAVSLNNSAVSAIATDTVTVTPVPLAVDLTNNAPAGDVACDALADVCGFGSGVELSAQTTLPIAPSETGTFILYVSNLSGVTDSYVLDASTDETFANQLLPAGWSVEFMNDANEAVSNSGSVSSGASVRIRAQVTVPADSPALTQSLYFRARSSLTALSDIKHDAVTVTLVEGVSLTPNNQGQTTPATFVNYTHLLQNQGNQAIGAITLTSNNTLAAQGWTSLIYEDTNSDGVFDANDILVSGLPSLAIGESKTLFVRVFAPSDAAFNVINVTTLTAEYGAGEELSVTDTTVINPFNVDVIKEQAIDSDCNGIADVPFVPTEFTANPGECIVYRVLTQNNSADAVFNVNIVDATPAFTVYAANQPAVRCIPAVCTLVGEPSANGTGVIRAEVTSITGGDQVELFFVVELESL